MMHATISSKRLKWIIDILGKNSIEMDDLINRWGNNNDKNQQAIHIDNIYWERVQLYIEGHSEGAHLTSGQFVLRNLTENKNIRSK
ncbi:hypothetical protein ACVPOQ_09680 [Staphylococcus aureus]